jgi:hypothetical protein
MKSKNGELVQENGVNFLNASNNGQHSATFENQWNSSWCKDNAKKKGQLDLINELMKNILFGVNISVFDLL